MEWIAGSSAAMTRPMLNETLALGPFAAQLFGHEPHRPLHHPVPRLLQRDADKRAEMIERALGLRTVPQIFIDGRHVGGYEELAELEREGKLNAWLDTPPETAPPEALASAGET